MEETYYFIMPSSTFSGLSTIASVVVAEARRTYTHAVVSEAQMQYVVEHLNGLAQKLLAEKPRCRAPKIEFSQEKYGLPRLHVDTWSATCYVVESIIK
jgi:hypothetical protein